MTQPIPIIELTDAPESGAKPISSRGRLRFLHRLGQGGMAEVHVATDGIDEDATLVVVKQMHQQHVHDAATVRMFQDEARLALRLSHPNIVRTERLGMFDGRHGIVMEYLEGQPFHQVLRKAYEQEASLSLEIVVQIAIAALDGLHYAHELKDGSGRHLGVVHRDVSPQNLFITYDGAVKLLDFGIAKNALADGKTRTGLLKGKLSYMAPEQARGESLDRRADIWSLGVMLWEAVTGARLFRGANEAATLNLTLTQSVPPPSMRRPDLPRELEAILMRALSRSPVQRYPTASAMRDDLEAWLSSRELTEHASVAQLMHRLFAAEMRSERAQIREQLRAAVDSSRENHLTLVAPLGVVAATASGLRATQNSTVHDLMDELTRQRRTTTRLLTGLLAIVSIAAVIALYVLASRAQSPVPPAPGTKGAVALAAPPVASPPVVPAATSAATTATAPTPPKSPPSPAPRQPFTARRSVAQPEHERAHETSAPSGGEPVRETGLLNLDTSPWSVVSASGRVLGQTPLVGAVLPAGTHVLLLSNPELGLKTTYQVTIAAGRTTARRVGLE